MTEEHFLSILKDAQRFADSLASENNFIVERVGAWIWLDTKERPTKELAEKLKNNCFRFSPVRRKWYFNVHNYMSKKM